VLRLFLYNRKGEYKTKRPHFMGAFRHADIDMCGQSTIAELFFMRFHPNPRSDTALMGLGPGASCIPPLQDDPETRKYWTHLPILRSEGLTRKPRTPPLSTQLQVRPHRVRA
jgi:hypothetical protein